MSKINLLPWREDVRKVRNRIFYAVLSGSALSCIGIVILISMFIQTRIEVQTANVEYIEKELLSVKGEITEIKGLQANKKQLLDRMAVIASLQTDRYTIVKLLDMLPRVLPPGIYLTEVKRKEVVEGGTTSDASQTNGPQPSNNADQSSDKPSTPLTKRYTITVKGVALTSTSVSNLLKNLAEIKWISGIKLNEVGINKGSDSDKDKDKNKEKTPEGLKFEVEFNQTVTAGR